MNILITTTLNRNMTNAKIKPLCMLKEVERIYYVSDIPGPYFEKVKYYAIPGRVLKLSNNNSLARWASKFLMSFYLAISKRPDLLMSYGFIPHGINVILIGRLLHIPVCINFMGGRFLMQSMNPLLKPILLRMAGMADIITVTGSDTKGLLISEGIEASKISVISSAIDTARFFPKPAEKKYDIITAAQLIPGKRIDVFLEIVSRLKKSGMDIKAMVLGDGCLRKGLEALAEDKGLGQSVYFAGFRQDIETYLRPSRVFLLPTAREGLSLAMLEAMACGVVPVVSDVDNLSDAVKDRVNGRLVNRDDIKGFMSAVYELLKDRNFYEACSREAACSIKKGYTVEIASKKWGKILLKPSPPTLSHKWERENWRGGLLRWYARRLMAMGPMEVIYRLTRILNSKFLYRRALSLDKAEFLVSKPLRKAVFFIDEKDIDFIRTLTPTLSHKWERELGCFSHKWERGIVPLDDMKRRAGLADTEIKGTWDFNRMQWLAGYAQIYALNKDEKTAHEIKGILKAWIRENPFMKTANWIDSLEVSLRLLSLSWVYFLTKRSEAMDMYFEELFLRDIYLHAIFVENNLSSYSSANNHLIGEAAGLFAAGAFFPQLKGSDRWIKKARAILEREMNAQVYPDGVDKEQSSHYHEFVTDLYLTVFIIARKNNIMFSNDMLLRIEKMTEFLMNITDRNGRALSIGDNDGGSVFKLNISDDSTNTDSLLNTAGVLFKRGDFKRDRSNIDGKSVWLLGQEGYAKYSSLERRGTRLESKGFSYGGYYIMRHEELLISFDCGVLGYLSLAGHGHADSLSFTLNIGESPVLIDPGTFLYHSGGAWRDYFRSTAGHNTIRIDKLDQSEIEGPFLWGYKARSFLKYWSPNGGIDRVCGYHTGYTRLSDPVIHSREIALDKLKKEVIINDIVSSKKEHLVEQFYHLHPDCRVEQLNIRSFKIINAAGNSHACSLHMEIDRGFDACILKGSESPIAGWYSDKFGEKQKTITICNRAYSKGHKNFVTKIKISNNDKIIKP